MKRSLLSILSLILALSMLCGILAACDIGENETTDVQSEETTEKPIESGSEIQSDSNEESDTQAESEDSSEKETETDVEVKLEGDFGDTIVYANKLANQVQAYYVEAARENYRITNLNATIDYALKSYSNQNVTSIKSPSGGTYISNTMDVYVRMSDGNTYYASSSAADTRPNIWRLGYYYYDVHLLDQDFVGEIEYDPNVYLDVNLKAFVNKKQIGALRMKGDVLNALISESSDPYIYMSNDETSKDFFSFNGDEFNVLKFSMRSENCDAGRIYYLAGGKNGHTTDQSVGFSVTADGEWHDVIVLLSAGKDFAGTIKNLRIDFENTKSGDLIEIKDMKLYKTEVIAPELYLDRTFHTYSDKLHQELHFVAGKDTTGIEELGMITHIAADTVDKLIVKDANGTHDTLEGVDWATAEYAGFDIKGVGIFGYILPAHEASGNIKIELVDGNYIITQHTCPEDGTILAPVVDPSNDFRMGHRLYTDESHDFAEFTKHAEWERNPDIVISSEDFIKYDAIRGAYSFSIGSTGFNGPFLSEWNHHYSVSALIRSKVDRPIYIRTDGTNGSLEGAALLDGNDMVLPVPMEVSKNFGHELEEPIYDFEDTTYSETVFPLYVTGGVRMEFTVLNLYQNWGIFPIKQLSSIQYFVPYYHLSVGTTETSCIAPWFGARDLWTLPDFRAVSAPWWWDLPEPHFSNQPQHTHGGYQYFLQYTDADGNYVATENINNDIDASGPTYAEVDMSYISDDGKIAVTYSHIEFAQTDELRAMYEITYEVLEDVSFNNFKTDFSFYSAEGYAGYYQNLGYLNENNVPTYCATNGEKEPTIFKLGDEAPYFSMWNLNTTRASWTENNVNLGCLIYDAELNIDGEQYDEGDFVLVGKEYVYGLSLDLEKVTLKKGDTFKLNLILVPWGWYTDTDDSNMLEIRENTCLDPLTVEVTNGEKIESVYVPKVKSTDGKSAEFTLSGGTNNVAVRVYGFNKLTAPKLYELVVNEDGVEEWVPYVTCSYDNPDKLFYRHYYDGYYAYYEGDGTFSYSFGVDMTGVESRTFRIVAEEDFEPWPPIANEVGDSPLNVNYSAPQLAVKGRGGNGGVGSIEVSEDGSYVRFYGKGDDNFREAYFAVHENGTELSGQYIVMKYRIPASNTQTVSVQFYAKTNAGNETDVDSMWAHSLYRDDQWHIFVIDASKANPDNYLPADDGKYYAMRMRLDIFNVVTSVDNYIDVAFLGICDSIEKVCAVAYDVQSITLIEDTSTYYTLDTTTGEVIDSFKGTGGSSTPSTPTPSNIVYIDPENEQGYTKTTTSFASGLDFVNGQGDGESGDPAFNAYRSNHVVGPKVVDFDGPTDGNAYLALAGWTCVYEGIEKYVWSADGGKTWHDAVVYNRESLDTATGGIKNAGDSHFAATVDGFNADTYSQDYYAISAYQGIANKASGVAAHLTDYIGQEVDVTFAAVPKNAPNTLCLIGHIQNVRVYESNEAAKEAEKCKHQTAETYVFVDDGDDSTDAAKMSKTCECGEVSFGTTEPYFVFFINVLGTQDNVAPFVFETKYGFRSMDATAFVINNADKSFTADANGVLRISGWAGVNGGFTDIVFKVLDASGNELTNGWTPTNTTISNRSDLEAEMLKRNIEVHYGKGHSLNVDLSSYLATNENVTVQFAMVSASAPEGSNDKYVYMGEFTNVSKAE